MNLEQLFGNELSPSLDCQGKQVLLNRPCIVGILNVTPDSFSDGGSYITPERAIEQAYRMVEEGADIVDIGGESTRPGASSVSVEEEFDRVIPAIETLARQIPVPISIDTSKPAIMRAAVAAGAGMINDVRALQIPGAMEVAAELTVPICLMHMQGEPEAMQAAPQYENIVSDVRRFLAERIFACQMAGIDKKRLLIDPGFGFGKTLEHNLALLAGLSSFRELDCPILVGLSRKSMIGAITGREPGSRETGSVAAALLAVQRGAMLVRVHNVAATRDALAIWQALQPYRLPEKQKQPKATAAWEDD